MTITRGANESPQRLYINSWAAGTGQRIGARFIDSAVAACIVLLVLLVGPHGRPFAQDLIIVALVTTVESVSITRSGATVGMRSMRLRLAVVGQKGNANWLNACRHSVPVALCYPILVPGLLTVIILPVTLLVSIMLSPQRRGFHDRLSGTVVVHLNAPAMISDADLETWWDPGTNLVMSPWGRVPDLHDRRRARAHRMDGAWWMAATIAVATIVSVGMTGVPWLWLWLALVWIAIATIDETRWITDSGATPGHRAFGYRVVDIETGQKPSKRQALARAVVVTPLVYIPPLQLILGFWVHASALHRGPHDLIARTVVVEPAFERPSFAPPAPRAPWTLPPPPVRSPIPGPF